MNKKRKILTVAAMVVFGVIIVLHCVTWNYYGSLTLAEYQGTKAHGRYVGNPPAIKDVNMPLFALAVFYLGIFSLMGGNPNQEKETTKREKAEREKADSGVTAGHSAPSANLSKRRKADNYFAGAWRGEVSLGRSFWLNGVLLGLGLRLTIGTLMELAKEDPTLIARGLGGSTYSYDYRKGSMDDLVDSRDVARRNRLHRLCGLGSSGQNYSGYRRRGSFAFYLESGGKMKPTVLKDCIHC